MRLLSQTVRVLDGLRVADQSTGIAGGYCTKLLADAGAEVVRVGGPRRDLLWRWLDSEKVHAASFAADVAIAVTDDRVTSPVDAAVRVAITPFGRRGPWADRPATEFTLQALTGVIGPRGRTDRPPIMAGGRVGEWAAGTFAAAGSIAGWRSARQRGGSLTVDVSMLECMALALLVYPWLLRPGIDDPTLGVEIPSIEPTRDGWVGFCTMTTPQWVAFAQMMEREDLAADASLGTVLGRFMRRDELRVVIRDWTGARTTDEVIEAAARFRVPATYVSNGATITEHEPYRSRGVFVEHDGFRAPRAPVHFALREGTGAAPVGDPTGVRALDGVRVLDFTAFWAGPFATAYLAALGADVVKVEPPRRPDFFRFVAAPPPSVDGWMERGPLYHANNAAKRSLTIDLADPGGVAIVKQLVGRVDAVVENFTPRVLDGFGLGHEELLAVNPQVLVVRLPAFGLEGPWRDRPGFAQTVEQASGLAWMTGDRDGEPTIPRGPGDPLAGMHAAFGLLCALEHRERTGGGGLVEVPLCDVAANVAAEQVIEATGHGRVLTRDGNRSPYGHLQGLWRAEDRWIAIAAETPAQRRALTDLAGAEDDLETAIGAWVEKRSPPVAVDELLAAGVPAAVVVSDATLYENEQLRARGFFERVEHPIAGTLELPGFPMVFDPPPPPPWHRVPAPTFGQHNEVILRDELGLSDEQLASLRANGVITG